MFSQTLARAPLFKFVSFRSIPLLPFRVCQYYFCSDLSALLFQSKCVCARASLSACTLLLRRSAPLPSTRTVLLLKLLRSCSPPTYSHTKRAHTETNLFYPNELAAADLNAAIAMASWRKLASLQSSRDMLDYHVDRFRRNCVPPVTLIVDADQILSAVPFGLSERVLEKHSAEP